MKIFKNNSNNNFEHQKKFPRTKKTDFLYKILLASKANEQGSGLVFAFSVGLLLLILGTATIITSGQNKTNAVVNENVIQSGSITESGIAKIREEINGDPRKRGLLLFNYDPSDAMQEGDTPAEWIEEDQELTYSGINSCGSTVIVDVTEDLDVIEDDEVIDVAVGTGSASGTYTLIAYRFNDDNGDGIVNDADSDENGTGRLLIEGKLNSNIDSKQRLYVEFPVRVDGSASTTGSSALIANQIAMGQSDAYSSSITCTDPTLCVLECDGTQATDDELEEGIGASDVNNAVMTDPYNSGDQSTVQIGSADIPNIPSAPGGVTVINAGDPSDLNHLSTDIVLPIDSVNDLSTVDVNGQNANVYYYQINNWNSSEILFNPPNADDQLRLYISGNITQNGNDDLRMNSSSDVPQPGQIRVYGGQSDGTYPNTSQTWELSGNACTMALIHAPKAALGIDGGGNGCSDIDTADATANINTANTDPNINITTGTLEDPQNTNIYGGVWVNTYNVIGNPSNSSVFYQQPGLMEVLDTEGSGFPGFDTVIMDPEITKLERWEAN